MITVIVYVPDSRPWPTDIINQMAAAIEEQLGEPTHVVFALGQTAARPQEPDAAR